MPGARRFVVDGLRAWERPELADVAELVVSELAGNAALHSGAAFMDVTLERREPGVRVAVEDDGPVGVDAVAPYTPDLGGDDDWEHQATTGRGLAIVSMLASRWGAAPTPRGKVVWAEVVDPDAVGEVRPPLHPQTPAPGPGAGPPPGGRVVRQARSPVEQSRREDPHLDALEGGLQLLGADRDNPSSQALAAEIERLLLTPAHARLTGRRQAQQALAEGYDAVDIEMAMPPEFGALVRQLSDAVSRADELCEDNQLLALASPPELRRLRAWMTHELVAQIELGRPPLPWSEWSDQLTDPVTDR